MLIKNKYPKAYLDHYKLKYLIKTKHETPIHSFTKKYTYDRNTNIHLSHLAEVAYEVYWEMQRFVHRYLIIPVQYQFTHRTNKLEKYFSNNAKQNDLGSSYTVYALLHRNANWI